MMLPGLCPPRVSLATVQTRKCIAWEAEVMLGKVVLFCTHVRQKSAPRAKTSVLEVSLGGNFWDYD